MIKDKNILTIKIYQLYKIIMKLRYLSDLHLEFIKPHKIDKFIKQIPINDCNKICI